MRRAWSWLLLVALLVAGGARAQVEASPPAWEVLPPLPPGGTASLEVTLTNRGPAPLDIFRVTALPPLRAVAAGPTIPRGGTQTLQLSLTMPRGLPAGNELQSVATVEFALPGQRPLTVPVRAAVAERGAGARTYDGPRPSDPLWVEVYYNVDCASCRRFALEVVEPLREYYGDAIRWRVANLLEPVEFARVRALRRAYGLAREANTYAFVGSHALAGEEIDAQLGPLLLAELRTPTAPPARVELELAAAAEDDTGLPPWGWATAWAMFLLGLLDGLNPCAFATAVFLVALLTRLGSDRATILAVGLAYAVAVYATYLLLGLGLLAALEPLSGRLVLANVLRWAVAGLALVAAAVQVADVLALRRGAPTRELHAQLPRGLKQRLHALLHALLRPEAPRWAWVVGASAAGVGVTLIELVCTSQVYLPVLVALRQPELRARALPLLLTYNAGFIAPLLVVIVAAWRGMASGRAAAWARQHLGVAKLALAVLLVGLAVWLLWPEVGR